MARTDDAITGGVIAALATSPTVHGGDVKVTSDGHRVHLQGIVNTPEERDIVEKIARGVPGVESVENDLTISSDGTLSDQDIECATQDQLARQGMPEIGVRVESGNIFLMGVVPSLAQKQQAMHIASSVKGAREVLSELHIAPGEPVDNLGLINAVAEAISDDARISVIDLEIHAEDGSVMLLGQVLDEPRRKLAEDIAEAVPGVQKVQNHLEVGGS